MAKNLLGCLPRLTEHVDRIIRVLAASRADYRALPREQLKREWPWRIGLLSAEELGDALINAVAKGHLTPREAQEIGSIIGVSLYDR
jgi:hypothetical protein